jgi:transposase
VNKELHTDILRRPRDEIRRRPERWRCNSSFLLHGNAPAHRQALLKDFLANNNVTTLERPPHSPDMVPFFLFSHMKSALKKERFCVAINSKNAKEELNIFSQNGFQEFVNPL